MRVVKRFRFEAAHKLGAGYKGPCARLHGHSYVVEVEVEGRVNEQGMVVDFKLLKRLIGGWIDRNWDHREIELTPNPTAEVMACELAAITRVELAMALKVYLVAVRVWETPDAYAEWRADDDAEGP
jgi:6-pyruvoyltetrahydropterin/6-carboxytetrahydropterin synthase